MRHRRAPISFELEVGAQRTDLQRVRSQLENELESALRASLAIIPAPVSPELPWQPNATEGIGFWTNWDQSLTVNRRMENAIYIGTYGGPRAYARIIPERWQPVSNAMDIFNGSTTHLTPLGRSNSMDWGAARGGFLSYRSSDSIQQSGITPSATRWFRDTGEIWGIDTNVFNRSGEESVFSFGYMIERWVAWLAHNASICREVGGDGPIHVRLGLDQIAHTTWAQNHNRTSRIGALETDVHAQLILGQTSEEEVRNALFPAFNHIRTAYGLGPISLSEFLSMA